MLLGLPPFQKEHAPTTPIEDHTRRAAICSCTRFKSSASVKRFEGTWSAHRHTATFQIICWASCSLSALRFPYASRLSNKCTQTS
eukprot:15432619-Alexandrium_andersonii.AAC.1